MGGRTTRNTRLYGAGAGGASDSAGVSAVAAGGGVGGADRADGVGGADRADGVGGALGRSPGLERSGLTGGLNRYRNVDRDWDDYAAYTHQPITVPTLFMNEAMA